MNEARTTRTRAATVAVLVAIVAVALNQRPAVVAVAPVLRDLRADTGLSAALAGLLTTVPVLCFGAFAPFAPRLARRIGLETAVALSLLLLAGGIALRLFAPVALLYAGSLIVGAAIAFANVLLPAYVKREFVRPGAVMGLYSASLNVGAAAGAALTVPLATALGLGWRGGPGLWLGGGGGAGGWGGGSRWSPSCSGPPSPAPAGRPAGRGPIWSRGARGACCASRSP